MRHFIRWIVSIAMLIAYDDKENSKKTVQCITIPSSCDREGDKESNSSAIMESTEHVEHVAEYRGDQHPADCYDYAMESPEMCPHCRDAYVGFSEVSDEESDVWYSGGERGLSPSETARIARFPSPPTHPFDPFYETKIQAIECMLNSPSQYESTDYSSSEDTPCGNYGNNNVGPAIPITHARHMWPSPPHERNSKGKERVQSSVRRDEGGISRNIGTKNENEKFEQEGRHSAASQRDQDETHAHSISHPGVGYFQLPESFLREFAL